MSESLIAVRAEPEVRSDQAVPQGARQMRPASGIAKNRTATTASTIAVTGGRRVGARRRDAPRRGAGWGDAFIALRTLPDEAEGPLPPAAHDASSASRSADARKSTTASADSSPHVS